MTLPLTLVVLMAGGLVGVAALVIIRGLSRPQPALGSALSSLQERPPIAQLQPGAAAAAPGGDLSSKIGAWLMTRLRIRPTRKVRTLLRLQQVTAESFYGKRLASAALFALLPLLFTVMAVVVELKMPVAITPVATLLLAGAGWMLPLWLTRHATTAADALDAILVIVDLVVIERLAGAASHQALANATSLSEHPVFVQIRHVITRAELERIEPWAGLMQLADDLDLPALRDVVAIARIEGGEKVPLLRARVSDLRNAQLRYLHEEANIVTQQMTIYKMLPVVAFMIVLLASPLISLLALS